jgi:hypothetical protein
MTDMGKVTLGVNEMGEPRRLPGGGDKNNWNLQGEGIEAGEV